MVDYDHNKKFNEMIREVVKARTAQIEKALEESIQSGRYGVLVLCDASGNMLSVEVSEEVPYGNLHYRRT